MRLLQLFCLFFIFISCSMNPKGEYSRTLIDRPYSLPHDVASLTIGSASQTVESDDSEDDSIDDTDSYSLPILGFEDGINSSVSWIYPLGFRAKFFDDKKHTFGMSAATLFIYTTYSLDYWMRLHEKISLRPFFKNEQVDLILFNEKKQIMGLELIYQHTKNLALKGLIAKGTYVGTSSFYDDLLESITGEEEDDYLAQGDISRLGLGLVYSLGKRWDIKSQYQLETITFDEFDLRTSYLDFAFVYFY